MALTTIPAASTSAVLKDVYTSSGTFTTSATINNPQFVYVVATGGGGGGGNTSRYDDNTNVCDGGGGGVGLEIHPLVMQ